MPSTFRFKSNFLSYEINGEQFTKKASSYFGNLKRQLSLPPGTPESVVDEIVNLVLGKAPSEELEMQLICYGTEGEGNIAGIHPRRNKKGKITSWYIKDRKRFIRAPGMFLKEAILKDKEMSRVTVEDTFIGYSLGNISFLNNATRFSYINATKGNTKTGSPGKVYGPFVTPYGMFAAFEYGTSAIGWGKEIKPLRGQYLSPTDTVKATSMVKTIPAFNMYSHISKELVRSIIAEKIRQVKFNS